MINTKNKLTNKDYSNFDHSKVYPRHRWYHFKEGFSPLIVEEAMASADVVDDDLVIDTFSGVGTVPVVASEREIDSIGFEVNPFMAFVSKVKQLNVRVSQFDKHIVSILDGVDKGAVSYLEDRSTFTKNNEKEKWLFNKDVLRAFEGGWQAANKAPVKLKDFFKLGLLSAVMDNCNAKKDGKCLRYKKEWKGLGYSAESFRCDFLKQITMFKEDIESRKLPKKGKIIVGDVRKKLKHNIKRKFKLCLTSPPYLNSFDYTDVYRPELFLGKFTINNDELMRLRLKTLRSHVQANWPNPKKSDFGILYDNCYAEVTERSGFLWNKRIPAMIQAYFEDMDLMFRQLKICAEKNASLWVVVSTSAYAGVEIPVDLILADIGTSAGWRLEEVAVVRHLRNSTQNANRWNNGYATAKRLRESIVIFKGIG